MPRKKQQPKPCSVLGCKANLLAQGRCSKHYTSGVKSGEITRKPQKVVNAGPCPVEGCGKPKYGSGLCQAHYAKFFKYGDPLGVAPKKTGGACSTGGCKGVVVANGVCAACYARIKKRGNTGYSKKHLARFENITDSKGYVRVPLSNHPNARKSMRVFEHRVVMSEMIGRPLLKNENVHHKNGKRDDNRPENLELWVTSQPSGQRPADLIDWARSILATYEADEEKFRKM